MILLPTFFAQPTKRFSVIDAVNVDREKQPSNIFVIPFRRLSHPYEILVHWDCQYTESIVRATTQRRQWCREVYDISPNCKKLENFTIQIGDFEHLEWEYVLQGEVAASSYLVRKGLSRKAQLSLQIKRYLAKHPCSILKHAVPETYIVETWSAFDDMKLDMGGGMMASFDVPELQQAPLRQRLDWSLSEVKALFVPDIDTITGEVMHLTEHTKSNDGTLWILKPSVTNKGADISIVRNWDDLLDALESTPDMREWVLQHYLPNPLLVNNGHKFHLRVYILCVGALRVFVFEDILMLIAAHKYDNNDIDDIYRHLTNTARAAEDVDFDEKLFVQLLRDLPHVLRTEYSHKFPTEVLVQQAINKIRDQIHGVVRDLFTAYENEYSIFCPMPNCFELYGLDFLVDDDLGVHFLEVNPGPDFKQTGDRLRSVIVQLWEQVFRIVVDGNMLVPTNEFTYADFDQCFKSYWQHMAPDFTLVYSKEWSVSQIKGGMSLK